MILLRQSNDGDEAYNLDRQLFNGEGEDFGIVGVIGDASEGSDAWHPFYISADVEDVKRNFERIILDWGEGKRVCVVKQTEVDNEN